MVAHALDDGRGAGVADTESFADAASQEDLARRRSIADDVARDRVVLGDQGAGPLRADDDPPPERALADIVVAVPEQAQGHTGRREGAETLARGAGERQVDGVVGQAIGCALVTSCPSIVPTVRLTLRIAIEPVTGVPSLSASRLMAMSWWSRAFSGRGPGR